MSSSPLKIEQKIIGWSIKKEAGGEQELEPVVEAPLITYERDEEMEGTTYKIKPPQIGCAMYVTINHITLPDGTKRPLEIFINSKKADQHQWIAGLTRMMSAVFHKPGPIDFVIEEMEQVYDPNGGYWADGKFQHSILAHIGTILRRHCVKIGAIKGKELDEHTIEILAEKEKEAEERGIEKMLCSACNEKSVIMMDNCLTCLACGESKCG